MMSQEQEQHLQRIKEQFELDVDAKYRAGVKEHGSFLLDLSMLRLCDEMLAESIDQYVYASSMKEKILTGMYGPSLEHVQRFVHK